MSLALNIGKLLCHETIGSAISRAYNGRIPYQGFTIDTSSASISSANVASIFWGLYERSEIRMVQQFLRSDLDVIELGSCLGIVALNISRIQQRDRKLVCVEANPELIQSLRTNIQWNIKANQASVVHGAIAYACADVPFHIDAGTLGSVVSRHPVADSVSVPALTLNEIIRTHEIEEFALVSDIEGAEAEILMDDSQALENCRQLFIELHPATYQNREFSVAELRERIEGLGFKLLGSRRNVFAFEQNR